MGTRTVTLGTSTIFNLSGTGNVWNCSTPTNLTLTAGTSTINITNTTVTGKTFVGGGQTYSTLNLPTGASNPPVTITGANTFSTLTTTTPGKGALTLPASTTTTVTNFTVNGTSAANLFTITSSSAGTAATLSKTSGVVTATFLSLKDSTATGGARFNAFNSTNVSGNTGWNFSQFYSESIANNFAIFKPRRRYSMTGDDGIQFPFVPPNTTPTWWEVQLPQLPVPSGVRNSPFVKAAALMRGDDGLDLLQNFYPAGWEIAPHQPQHPRPERVAAIMDGDDGAEAPFIPPNAPFPNGWEIQPIQPGHPRPERGATIMFGEVGIERPFANFFPVGWEIQPPQPPHPRPERFGAAAPYLALIETPFQKFVPLGWEQTTSMPLHMRWERSGAVMLGEQIVEARFTNFFPAGWEIQPPQPPSRPSSRLKHGGIARGDDGTQDRFSVFRPHGWEIQSPMLRHSFTAQRYTATKGSSLFPIFSNWVNSGWEIAPPFFRHPRPERSGALARGDDGNYAFFQAILPPPPSGYDQPFLYPRMPVQRRGAVMSDNIGLNIESVFRRFVDFGFENQPTQPFHTRRERAAAGMIGEDGTELPFIPVVLFPWGHEMPFVFPRMRFERAGAMRGDDGIEAPYIFVAPPFQQLLQGPPVYSRVRVERAAAMMPADPSTYRQFSFNPAGWEVVPPTMRQAGRPQRAGAVMFGENATEAVFRAIVTPWGHEAPYTALRVRTPLRGALMRGDDGIAATLKRLVAMGWQPSEPVLRPRKGWRGPQAFEQPVISFPNFLKPLWVDDSRVVQLKPRPRRGGALAVDTEMPQIIPFPVHLVPLDHWTPETFYRRRYTGAIVPWEGGWFMRRFVPVFYATSVITRYSAPTKITQASGDVEVTAAAARTVVRGEPQGR